MLLVLQLLEETLLCTGEQPSELARRVAGHAFCYRNQLRRPVH